MKSKGQVAYYVVRNSNRICFTWDYFLLKCKSWALWKKLQQNVIVHWDLYLYLREGGWFAMFTGIVVLLWTTEEYVKQHLFIMLCLTVLWTVVLVDSWSHSSCDCVECVNMTHWSHDPHSLLKRIDSCISQLLLPPLNLMVWDVCQCVTDICEYWVHLFLLRSLHNISSAKLKWKASKST